MTHRRMSDNKRQQIGLAELIREVRRNTQLILERQDYLMAALHVVYNQGEDQMSRYTDMLANVTKLTDKVSALKAVITALADTPSEAEWKELNDKILANADEVQAAIDAGSTDPVPAPDPGGSTGGVGGSTGGV